MNEKVYTSLTRIVLAVALAIAVAGSLAFVLLEKAIQNMPFSDF